MARIRSIKPEFFTSPDVAALTMFERVLFIGLWTHADDDGRCSADARLIRAALFALDDDVTVQQVADGVDRLFRRGQVVLYEASGNSPEASPARQYLAIKHWDHQKISHPSPSKLPGPLDDGSHLLTPHSGEVPEASVKPPETFRPDQGSGKGSGIRDQGFRGAPVSLETTVESYRGAPRQEDLWGALEHELGPACTTTERNIRGKTHGELETLHSGPDTVHERCAEYRRRWPGAALTDSALLKHWSGLAEAQVITGQMNTGTAALLKVAQEASHRRSAS